VIFSTLNRNAKAIFAIVGTRYILQLLAARHPRLRQVHPAAELRRMNASATCDTQSLIGIPTTLTKIYKARSRYRT